MQVEFLSTWQIEDIGFKIHEVYEERLLPLLQFQFVLWHARFIAVMNIIIYEWEEISNCGLEAAIWTTGSTWWLSFFHHLPILDSGVYSIGSSVSEITIFSQGWHSREGWMLIIMRQKTFFLPANVLKFVLTEEEFFIYPFWCDHLWFVWGAAYVHIHGLYKGRNPAALLHRNWLYRYNLHV